MKETTQIVRTAGALAAAIALAGGSLPARAQILGPVPPTVRVGRRGTRGYGAGSMNRQRRGAGGYGARTQPGSAAGSGAAAAGRRGGIGSFRSAPADLASEVQALKERHPAAVAKLPGTLASPDRQATALVDTLPLRAQWAYYLTLEDYPSLDPSQQANIREFIQRAGSLPTSQRSAFSQAVTKTFPARGETAPRAEETASADFARLASLLPAAGTGTAAGGAGR